MLSLSNVLNFFTLYHYIKKNFVKRKRKENEMRLILPAFDDFFLAPSSESSGLFIIYRLSFFSNQNWSQDFQLL
jgi:hypothetical protein